MRRKHDCLSCGNQFTRKSSLIRHQRENCHKGKVNSNVKQHQHNKERFQSTPNNETQPTNGFSDAMKKLSKPEIFPNNSSSHIVSDGIRTYDGDRRDYEQKPQKSMSITDYEKMKKEILWYRRKYGKIAKLD